MENPETRIGAHTTKVNQVYYKINIPIEDSDLSINTRNKNFKEKSRLQYPRMGFSVFDKEFFLVSISTDKKYVIFVRRLDYQENNTKINILRERYLTCVLSP